MLHYGGKPNLQYKFYTKDDTVYGELVNWMTLLILKIDLSKGITKNVLLSQEQWTSL